MRRGPTGTMVLIGVGLVGTSVALAASRAGWRVHLRDRNTSHRLVAAGLGAGTVDDPDPAAVDLVVVAVPPDHCAPVIADALREFERATVTDVASVKGALTRQLLALVPPGLAARHVGSHPMAGSHRSGPAAADADLFVDRTWVVTPSEGADPDRVARVRDLALACGATVVAMTPDDHDRAVAAVSHLPHLASVLVASQLTELSPEQLGLAGQGLRDVTRIAGSDPALWVQILSANADAVRPRLHALRDGAERLLADLDDRERLTDALSGAVAGTRRIPGKHGRPGRAWADVVVEIPDAPGALARLFADVGATEVNVEDMRIEHDPVREVGSLALAIDAERAGELSDALEAAGWLVRPG